MTTDQVQTLQRWRGRELVDANGSKIGKIYDIYQDEDTGQPEWLAVSTGLFGTKVSFVPLPAQRSKVIAWCRAGPGTR